MSAGLSPHELQQALAHFTGTENYWRHALVRRVKYTDGVRYFAKHAGNGAYWLLDILATEALPHMDAEGFLSITLNVRDGQAELSVGDGNGKVCLYRHIEFTDAPEGEWKFFMADEVIMLPSEY